MSSCFRLLGFGGSGCVLTMRPLSRADERSRCQKMSLLCLCYAELLSGGCVADPSSVSQQEWLQASLFSTPQRSRRAKGRLQKLRAHAGCSEPGALDTDVNIRTTRSPRVQNMPHTAAPPTTLTASPPVGGGGTAADPDAQTLTVQDSTSTVANRLLFELQSFG